MTNLLLMLVGAAFLFAFIRKFSNPYEFLRSVYGYAIIAPPLAKYATAALLGVELVAGIGLLLGLCREPCRRLAQLTLLVFVAAQVSVVARGLTADCGCGFAPDETIGVASIVRTSLLLVAASAPDLATVVFARAVHNAPTGAIASSRRVADNGCGGPRLQ